MKKIILLMTTLLALPTFAFQLSLDFSRDTSNNIESQARIEKIKNRIENLLSTDDFSALAQDPARTYKCFNRKNLPMNLFTVSDVVKFVSNAQASVQISFFTEDSSVVGSTSGNHISFNTVFLAQNSDAEVANTLFHETLHTLGFGHCGVNNVRIFPKIKKSVPYQFGEILEEIF